MKCRLPRWCLFVLLGSLVFGSREASAQGKTNFARVEERQFLLYALENMSIQRVANTNKPGRPFEAPSVILGRFLARQRLLFDTVRRHVQKRKKTELVPLFEAYEKELNLRDDYRKALEKPWADYIKKMSAASSAASSRVLLTGLGYALAPVAEGEDERRNFARGMNAMFNTAIVEGEKLRMFGAGAAKEYGNALKKTDEEFSPRLEKSHKEFQEQLEEFVAMNKTEDAEFAFQTAAAEPARNPFLLTAKAATILKNKGASIKELMEQAEVCRRAAGMAPSDRVFNIYRAAFLGVAGTIANRAATKDLGATGFPSKPKDAPEAGKLAYKIWNAYSKVEPFDTNYTDEVVQAFILACAQAGYAASAQPVILKAVVQPRRFGRAALNVNASARPEFWYDCARVTSMLGNTRLSMDCLQQAVKLGFREKESAKVHPDLRNVREDSVTAATFKRLFP
ncbi:MAG TPA: hypothetical protein VH575_08495 [Gemmataceae bacterium]|jgi:hypothetical protein